MQERINPTTLRALACHNNKLGLIRILKSMRYERAAELPLILDHLHPRFDEPLHYLDVGTGDSILPTFLYDNSRWSITVVDKHAWVSNQNDYMTRLGHHLPDKRFQVVKQNVLKHTPKTPYDIITSISVIEHIEAPFDLEVMKYTASLLQDGGIYLLTTLINEGFPRDFYKAGEVYGDHRSGQVFYQRHYDLDQLHQRIIAPSGLEEAGRVYFGEYDFPFGEKLLFPPVRKYPGKLLYSWASHHFARQFLSYSKKPVSRATLSMDTAAGVILLLRKPAG
ncbi:MAG: methyltransferase domain-containing protein [Magnetococcales bacterium]|nr:methyltransferase domain-containing protein [Magnetococcales bacterium]